MFHIDFVIARFQLGLSYSFVFSVTLLLWNFIAAGNNFTVNPSICTAFVDTRINCVGGENFRNTCLALVYFHFPITIYYNSIIQYSLNLYARVYMLSM